jgi:hypothetical protein
MEPKTYGRTMTTAFRLTIAALAAAVVAGLSGTAVSASSEVPFSANYSGAVAWTSQTTVSFAGSGYATHMGEITTQGQLEIIGSNSSCANGILDVNVETLAAANGDVLSITSHNAVCPIGLNRFHGIGQWSVTGGSGRFRGASGAGAIEGEADFNTGTFTISANGTITLRAP